MHEVLKFSARLLREKLLRDAQGHLATLVQLLDDLVDLRIILEPPPASHALVTPRRFNPA